KLYELLNIDPLPDDETAPVRLDAMVDTKDRQRRQVQELIDFTQHKLHLSYKVRDKLWSAADRSTVDKFVETVEKLRQQVYEEMTGKLPDPAGEPHPRTRKILDEPEYVGYEVMLDVYPDVVAGGILLLPKDLKDGERRPVVVCQHGLEGVPMDTITGPG